MAEYRAVVMKNNYDNEDNQPDNGSSEDTDNYVDVYVVAVALELYTEALIDPELSTTHFPVVLMSMQSFIIGSMRSFHCCLKWS
jgi:hypothetical protein